MFSANQNVFDVIDFGMSAVAADNNDPAAAQTGSRLATTPWAPLWTATSTRRLWPYCAAAFSGSRTMSAALERLLDVTQDDASKAFQVATSVQEATSNAVQKCACKQSSPTK
ncbi:hypothetical protein LMH87_000781 [Akanthomyces muscarius]|uniref:Uncharacterized protein n=1 Tax=Akanthomyces muscarius TaxID=2231603 RepID=A0A9W8UMW3_AKAMU|nr:hypothetical protein LMH87_000781 [Akanthomyces muscarius]KAJ4155542.1 hypothetical protein LMH87_000781 [Akanthomyces muscarius]